MHENLSNGKHILQQNVSMRGFCLQCFPAYNVCEFLTKIWLPNFDNQEKLNLESSGRVISVLVWWPYGPMLWSHQHTLIFLSHRRVVEEYQQAAQIVSQLKLHQFHSSGSPSAITANQQVMHHGSHQK